MITFSLTQVSVFSFILYCADECLDTIFKGGKVLSYALAYLESETSTHTQRANAALLVANMARTEDNCRVLVEQGVVPHLVALLKEEESKEVHCMYVCVCIIGQC